MRKPKRTKKQDKAWIKKKAKLEDGCDVTAGGATTSEKETLRMPSRFKDDHPHVLALLDESERLTELGLRWLVAKVPNQKSYFQCVETGWAMNVAAAHLRCRLKGELLAPPRSVFGVSLSLPDGSVVLVNVQAKECHRVAHDRLNADGVIIEVPGEIGSVVKQKLNL